MKTLISLLMALFFTVAQSQDQSIKHSKKITFGNAFNLAEYESNGVSIIDSTLSFDQDKASIIISRQQNLKKIRFRYTSNFVGDANLVLEYRTSSPRGVFKSLNYGVTPLPIKQASTPIPGTLYPYVVQTIFDIKISLQYLNNGQGLLRIDDLEFEYFTNEEVQKQLIRIEIQKAQREFENSLANKNQLNSYNSRVQQLAIDYPINVALIRSLKIRTNGIAAVSKTFDFVETRTKMYDPNSYKQFTEKVNYLRTFGDTLQRIYLDSLIEDMKNKPLFLKDEKKRADLSKFTSIAGDLINVFTAGQFKGIVNSIHGLLTNTFNFNNLNKRVPEVVNEIRKKSGKDPIRRGEIEGEVEKVIKESIKLQKFFFGFFPRLEKNRREFGEIIMGFRAYNIEIDELAKEMDDIEKDYFKKIGVQLTGKRKVNFMLEDQASVRLIDTLRNEIQKEILKLQKPIPSDPNSSIQIDYSRVVELEQLNVKVVQAAEKHKSLTIKFRALFDLVEKNLGVDNNPFIDFDTNTKVLKKVDGYLEYETLRQQAIQKHESLRTSLNSFLAPIN